MCLVRGYDDQGGGLLRIAGFSPPVGCYYGPFPVMTVATLGGPSRCFGLRVRLRVDLIGSRPYQIPIQQYLQYTPNLTFCPDGKPS